MIGGAKAYDTGEAPTGWVRAEGGGLAALGRPRPSAFLMAISARPGAAATLHVPVAKPASLWRAC